MESTKKFAILRIVFGFIWAIDSFFKWQPDFFRNFIDYLASGAEEQSVLVQKWVHLWISIIGINPHFFAVFVALAETALALSLVFGIFTRLACYGGITLSFIIWSTAEGFGGPYKAGSTDIGTAVIYILVFAALLISKSWEEWSMDKYLFKPKRHYYKCNECGLLYLDKNMAEKCQVWCSEHKSCNLDIINYAVTEESVN
ncbi:MAG: DoxX family protein [Patescibacteria group bacterium]|nr:DoxX family protein [Patescibacteria group bacterium]MDE2438083.1 DoxX family protein [Patescibacteria group bacterium]